MLRSGLAEPSPTLVTVAIPAYNAGTTLDETLRSVRGQSYSNIEIIVVDDGSSDDTALVARRHAHADPRVTLVSQSNGGVSSARNAALARASGQLFATIDADDLWHPDMIARQIRSMRLGTGAVVLSYTWFAYIDDKGRVLSTAEPNEEGNVIPRMCRGNLVGNSSSAVMVTNVLREVGGWDPTIRDGNEDYKTFFLMAERGDFAVVRSHLLGYRQVRGNRSSKSRLMLATFDQVVDEFRPRYSAYANEFSAGRGELIAYLFDKAVLHGNWETAFYLVTAAWADDKAATLRMLSKSPLIASRLLLPLTVRALLRTSARGERPKKGNLFLQASATPCCTENQNDADLP